MNPVYSLLLVAYTLSLAHAQTRISATPVGCSYFDYNYLGMY